LEDLWNLKNKFTVGLGQEHISIIKPYEDIASMCMNVYWRLMKKYNIKEEDIGRLEIGTETLIDHSKSIKTSIMNLFTSNFDVEGVTNINACYGGTSALFNCVN